MNQKQTHFISGLPRSGSTLLAAILQQNPNINASIESPLANIQAQLVATISRHESGLFVSDSQRVNMLRSLFNAYYADIGRDKIVFDTNRNWCCYLPSVREMFPQSRVVCCVRNPAWILDSIERHAQRSPFSVSRLFEGDACHDVYSRAEYMCKNMVGGSLRALRQAWCGEEADMLVVIRYETMVTRPKETIERLYALLNMPLFDHEFNNVTFSSAEFDRRIGAPGFHDISGPVVHRERATILPDDLFEANSSCFWESEAENVRGVVVL